MPKYLQARRLSGVAVYKFGNIIEQYTSQVLYVAQHAVMSANCGNKFAVCTWISCYPHRSTGMHNVTPVIRQRKNIVICNHITSIKMLET